MKTNERMRKVFSILLCLCMVLQYVPTTAFAVTTAEDGLCEHHTAHTAECGYVEAVAGQPCAHEHSETCYAVLACVHEQEEHDCTVESGCVTMALDCHHTHGDCGYSEGTAEVPCGHVHNESCGYAEAVAGTPCANAETDPECDHAGGCGYVAAVEGQPCGHTEHTDCGYAPATEGTPCTHTHAVKVDSADSCYKLLCSHSSGGHDNTCGYVAAVEAHECHYECAECAAAPASEEPSEESTEPVPVCSCEAAEGEAHTENCALYVAPADPVCTCEAAEGEAHTENCALYVAPTDPVCTCEAAEGEAHAESCALYVAPVEPVCDCGTDDALIHATTCAVYVAPETAVCYCTEKCSDTNVWCDVCGFDYTQCGGTDTATVYADEWFKVSGNTVTIDGTLGGKTEASEDDVAALVEKLKYYVDSGITTITVTGEEPAMITITGTYTSYTTTAISEAIARLSGSGTYDADNPYNGKIDLILSDVTEIVDYEFQNAYALNSITLPNVTKLGTWAFFECQYLKKITFGSVVTGGTPNTNDFQDVGTAVDGCDLVLSCSQNTAAAEYQPNASDGRWWADTEWKSYTLAHFGGVATCTTQAVCKTCDASYGEKATDNHTGTLSTYAPTADGSQHAATWSCCSKVETADHSVDSNGFCTVCGGYQPAVLTTDKYDVNGDEVMDAVYEISNAGQLYWFANLVNTYNEEAQNKAANAILTKNITINQNLLSSLTYDENGAVTNGDSFRAWTPIGTVTGNYTGIFDGNNKTVSGLYFNSATSRGGLFGLVGSGGTVKNVGVIDSYLSGYQYVGGVVGNNAGTVQSCYNSGTVTGEDVGGVVGRNDGTVQNCHNTGAVTGGDHYQVGGVVGSNGGTVQNCYNTGTVNGSNCVGGVVGVNGSTGTVESCYNTGAVTGGDYYEVGGVVGRNENGNVTNCYNSGSVSGSKYVGGVVGYLSGGTVRNCYNTGTVNGSEYDVGGVVGYMYEGTVQNCYYNTETYTGNAIGTNEESTVDALTGGKTAAQFASGEVAYLLNGDQSTIVFMQTLGTDDYPNFTGEVVYYGYNSCAETATKIYTNDSAVTAEKPAHSGGTATCLGYKCTVCGAWYGDKDANNHASDEFTYTANEDGTTHTKKYKCCGAVASANEEHTVTTWTQEGITHTGNCDHCGASVSGYCDKDTTTGKCTVCDNLIPVLSVTSGETVTYYPNVDDVLEKSASVLKSGDIVRLLDDCYGDDYLTIPEGVTFDGGNFTLNLGSFELENNGTITGGTFEYDVTGSVSNESTGTITGGTFICGVDNSGTITGGNFTSVTILDAYSSISGNLTITDSLKFDADFDPSSFDPSIGEGIIDLSKATLGGGTNGDDAISLVYHNSSEEWNWNNEDENVVKLKLPEGYCVFDSDDTYIETLNYSGSKYIRKHSHTLDGYGYDGDSHWTTCSCGYADKTTEAAHTPTYSASGSTIAMSCSVCGANGTAAISATGKTYDGDAVEATVTNTGILENKTVAITYEVKDGATLDSAPANAGTYTASITMGDQTVSVEFTIAKATPEVTAPTAVSNLIYSGEALKLINAGNTNGGTMQYSLAEDGTYGSEVPTGTNAGTYTVWYKVVGGNNYNDVAAASITVTIEAKKLTELTFVGLNEVYAHTGSEVEPEFTVKDGDTTLAVNTDYTVAITNNTDVGTATITITLTGNYSGTVTKTFEIKTHVHDWSYALNDAGDTITATCKGTIGTCPDAEQSVTLNASDAVYSGEMVQAEVTKDGTDLTHFLHYTGTGYDSENAPINAGTYTVTMTVGDKSVSDTFTISPKNIANCRASLAKDSFTYTGTAPELTVTVVDNGVGSNPLTEGTDYTVGAAEIDAGNHKLTVTGKGNYTGTVELDYTITAKEVSITGAEIKGVTYANSYTLTVTGVTFDGAMEGETLDYTATAALTGTNAVGDQEATVTVVLKDSNYTLATATYKTTVKISKADAAVASAPTAKELTYTSSAQALVTVGEAKGGEMQYSLDGTNYSTTIPTGTNAKTYTVYYYVKGDSNHNDTTPDSLTVTIGKANPDIGTVSYSGETLYDSTDISTVKLTRTDMTVDGTLVLTDSELTADEGTYNWKFTPEDTENYNTITGTVTLTVAADVLEKIEASGTLSKSNYTYGESFAIDGLTVTATYTSGATKDVTDSVTFNENLAVGQTSVELTYQGKTCEVTGITVAKKQLVISDMSWDVPENAVYNNTAYTATLIGDLPDGVKVDVSGNTGTNAGDYTAKAVFSLADGYSADNYEIVNGGDLTAQWSIAKKNISGASITLDGSLTYNGSEQTMEVTEVKIDGLTVTYDVSGNTGTDAKDYTLTVTGTGNFEGTATKTWSIAKKNITGAAITLGTALTYNGSEQTMEVTEVKIDGLTVTYDVSGNEQTNAGRYTLTVTGNGNFEGSATAGWSIGKAALTVTAKDHTITYGNEPSANGVSYDGFVSSEIESVLGGELTYSYNYEQYGNVGTYTITPSGLTSDNYEITFADGTLTVTAKAITVTAEDKSKTYGDADPELTYKVEGLVNGDKLSGALTREAGTDFGTYAITQGTLTAGSNYTINYTGATLTINTKAITEADVTLNGSLTYNGSEQTQPITVTEGITYEVSGNKETNVGTYELTVKGTGNYTGSVNVEWIIAKAAVTITADNKVIYVGAGLPTLTYTVSGLMEGDELTKEPTLTTDADEDQAGSYVITVANADAGNNYEISYVGGTLTVMDAETEVETRIEKTELTEVPDGLKNTEFNTVEAITEELVSRILAASTGYSEENMEHYDVTLQFSLDAGNTWILATEENFPTEGITVTLPYPEGTNARDYEFVVSHMFTVTSQRLGTTAGDVELPKVEETANGIRVTLNGLSPVTVAARYHDHIGGTATCTEKAVCTICGNAYGEVVKTNHAGGTEVKDAKEATCGAEGYTGDTYCKSCGEITEKGTTIKATGEHTYGNWKVVKEATKTAKGEKQRTCSVCGHVDSKEIPVLSDTPATGDDSDIMLWSGLLCVSTLGLVVLLADHKRRRSPK